LQYPDWRVQLAYWVVRFLTVQTTVIGLDNIPEEGALLVGNHRSWIDGFHIWPRAGRAVVFFAALDVYYRVPVFGSLIKHAGFIPVPRGKSRSRTTREVVLEATRQATAGGLLVATYGEGRIVPADGKVYPIKPGIGELHEEGVPIVPMVAYGAEQVGRMSGRARWFPRLWRRVTVVFHQPLPQTMSGDEVLKHLQELFAAVP
jgi:1-acyl-sn-glycerol-3-phosphate acyltransferase